MDNNISHLIGVCEESEGGVMVVLGNYSLQKLDPANVFFFFEKFAKLINLFCVAIIWFMEAWLPGWLAHGLLIWLYRSRVPEVANIFFSGGTHSKNGPGVHPAFENAGQRNLGR